MKRPPHPAQVPTADVHVVGIGGDLPAVSVGDLVLVHHYHSLAASMIRLGQRLRRRTRPYAFWNHCMIVVQSDPPVVVQEEAAGAVMTPLAVAIAGTTYAVVHPYATEAEYLAAANFARWAVGSGYGWLSIAGDAMDDLTGLHVSFGSTGRMVCSALACRAHERLGLIPDVEPSMVQPALMALYYDVKGPE